MATERILVMNLGSTSSKIAVYEDDKELFNDTIRHSAEELAVFDDVTDQFDDPENDNNKLVIDAGGDIDIPDAAHGGGGLAPSVDPWENENIDIPLG